MSATEGALPTCGLCGCVLEGEVVGTAPGERARACDCPVCGTYYVPDALASAWEEIAEHPRRFAVMAEVEVAWRTTGRPVVVRAEWLG